MYRSWSPVLRDLPRLRVERTGEGSGANSFLVPFYSPMFCLQCKKIISPNHLHSIVYMGVFPYLRQNPSVQEWPSALLSSFWSALRRFTERRAGLILLRPCLSLNLARCSAMTEHLQVEEYSRPSYAQASGRVFEFRFSKTSQFNFPCLFVCFQSPSGRRRLRS